MIEQEASLVKGRDQVQLQIHRETYQNPPAFGLPASGPITVYRLKVFFLSSQGQRGEWGAYPKEIKAIGPESSRAPIEEAFRQVYKMYQGDGWKAL